MLLEKFTRSFVIDISRSLVLWLISRKPKSGYEIISEVEKFTGHTLGPGVIYPLLSKLERKGYIVGDWVEKGKRRIKYYSITNEGKEILNRIRSLFKRPIREVITELLG